MRSRSWSKILWIAALLPLLAASVLPGHLRSQICRVTGAAMDVETGCPAAPMAQNQTVAQISESTSGSISDLGCCLVTTIDLGRLLADHRSDEGPLPLFSPVFTMPVVRVVLAPRATPSLSLDRPPPVGPPLLLLKRSFLI